MSERPSALRAEDLYRFYRAGDEETLALRGVTLAVEPGEVVLVAGPSGSGKSTLLSCLSGLDEPSGGTVWLGGERISHRNDAVRARLRADHVGVLSQEGDLLPHLSVVANVRLARSLATRRRTRGRRTTPDELLAAFGIGHRRHAFPAELSGGEAARAGLAVALANEPDVVVADEPTGELDGTTEDNVLALLRQAAERGSAVVLASHSAAVRRAADRVIVLEDGVVQ